MGDRKFGSRFDKSKSENPIPVAVALDAIGDRGGVPARGARVVATGRGAVAEQILSIAFEQGVPVREDADLAQILSTLDIESEIPIDALAAVAEIMSYVYRMNRAWPQHSADERASSKGPEVEG